MTRKPKGSGRMIVLKCRVTDWVSFKFIQFLKLHSTGLLRQKYKTSRVINKIVAFYALPLQKKIDTDKLQLNF